MAKIRLALPADGEEILKVMASHKWKGRPWKWDVPPARRYLEDYFGCSCRTRLGDILMVMVEKGQIIGVTGYALDGYETANYWLSWFYVHASFTRLGLGRRLLHHTEEALLKMRVSRLFITTSTHAFYRPARHLYACFGYREVGRIKNYYTAREDQIILSRLLAHKKEGFTLQP